MEPARGHAHGWRDELAATPVDLLFVESAWNGNDGAWRLAMTGDDGPSQQMRALVERCRADGVPTVFWNKEEPPNYALFLETARLFDHVFTVDAGRIPDYRRDLGHDRVALLPFGAQPRNPHTRAARRGAHARGGLRRQLLRRQARRASPADGVRARAGPAPGARGVLAPGRRDARYQFPRRYAGALVGSLPYRRLLGTTRRTRSSSTSTR